MAFQRVIINKEEVGLTNEEVKEFIMDRMFTAKGVCCRVEDFASRAKASGLEWKMNDDFERLINELIHEGKVRIEYQHFHAAFVSGYFLVIKRIV